MGEYLQRDPKDPAFVADNRGMDIEQAKAFAALAGVANKADDSTLIMAKSIAAQTGKSLEEILTFLNDVPKSSVKISPLSDETEILEEVKDVKRSKVIVPIVDIPEDDKFIVLESVDPSEASETDLEKLAEEEENENDWSGKIRVGSKVKIVYQVSASRINWVGKKGNVTRVVGNEAAKVFEVEFHGGKIPKIRLNKKTGKLERGYVKKIIRNTFSEDQVELVD